MQMIFPGGFLVPFAFLALCFCSYVFLIFLFFSSDFSGSHRPAHASEIPSTPEVLFRHVKIISPGPVLSALLDDLDVLHEIRVAVP